jgi:hypothetical protein
MLDMTPCCLVEICRRCPQNVSECPTDYTASYSIKLSYHQFTTASKSHILTTSMRTKIDSWRSTGLLKYTAWGGGADIVCHNLLLNEFFGVRSRNKHENDNAIALQSKLKLLCRHVRKIAKNYYQLGHMCASVRPYARMEQLGSHWTERSTKYV